MLALLLVASLCTDNLDDPDDLTVHAYALERTLWYSVQMAIANTRHHGEAFCALTEHPFFFANIDDTTYCGQLSTGEWSCQATACGKCVDEL